MAATQDALLFYHPCMEKLARGIEARCRAGVTLKPESRQRRINFHQETGFQHVRSLKLCPNIDWGRFPDGFPNLFIRHARDIIGRDVFFLASFHTPQLIFEQLSVIYAIPRQLVRSFTLILPYFPTGTMERVEYEGQVATAKSLAMMISNIPMTLRGPALLMVYDIHALQERFYFSDTQIIPRLETAIPLLLRELEQLLEQEKVCIAFPDDGAHKRFSGQFENYQHIICAKVREGDKRIVKVKEGNAQEKHVVIVDDLIQSGGTMAECARALKRQGAAKISAYVTHAIFPNASWKRFTHAIAEGGEGESDSVRIENFWITDSLPWAYDIVKENPPFRLLSLADVIADSLLCIDLIM